MSEFPDYDFKDRDEVHIIDKGLKPTFDNRISKHTINNFEGDLNHNRLTQPV